MKHLVGLFVRVGGGDGGGGRGCYSGLVDGRGG